MVPLFSHLAICCDSVFFFLIPIHSLCHSVEIPSPALPPVPTKEPPSGSSWSRNSKIATCFLTLCCAFLFLGRGGDRNLLPSLRQRTWARSRTANGEHGAVIVIVIVNSPRAAAALAACSAVPRDSKAVTCC